MRNDVTRVRRALIPEARAAWGLAPVIRNSKPIEERLSSQSAKTVTARATHYIDQNFLQGSAGIGFTAITVSLLGRNRPIGIVWGSLLFAALEVGGSNMQANTGIPYDLATVIQSAIVIFVATPVLVKEIFRLRALRAESVKVATAGWGS